MVLRRFVPRGLAKGVDELNYVKLDSFGFDNLGFDSFEGNGFGIDRLEIDSFNPGG
jgi:hypothetical protein